MNELFLKIINMSISASWLILAVLILRLVLKKAPKWVNVLLWGIVAVRLICPLSFESALSLIPSSETIPLDIEMAAKPTIDSGVPAINSVVNPVLSSFAPPQHVLTSANPLQIWIPILNIIWLIGVGALLLYTAVSYWRLCRKVDTAVRYKGNIFQSENVSSPFVLGIIKPRIYLPFNMNGQDLEHVVAHEQAHIRRKDHWWKPLGFLLLTISLVQSSDVAGLCSACAVTLSLPVMKRSSRNLATSREPTIHSGSCGLQRQPSHDCGLPTRLW